jgi:tetratricopeptide (TPR) repeat protein
MILLRPDIEAYRLMRAGRFADALPFAEEAVQRQVLCSSAHGLLATILMQLGRTEDANAVVAQALECAGGDADAYDALAHVSMQLGEHERSNQLYRRVATIAPDIPRFWYNLASSERSFGRLFEAEEACDRAIALDRTQYPSYLLRSELRLQTPEANHVDRLIQQLNRVAGDDRATMFLGYALGKELDDLKRYDEAFHWFSTAAATRRRHLAYDVGADERKLFEIADAYPRSSAISASEAVRSRNYVFIIGLPRSGTTLLERILSALKGVQSRGETNDFARALMAAAPSGLDSIFDRAAAADPSVVAANYEKLAQASNPGATVLEKLPMNYLYAGAIRRALPHAKLVLVRREPLDSCFAMYRTLFGEAYPFSYNFDDLARYYAAFERLMAHWQQTLGNALYSVSYEELVRDPIRVGSAVARYCGLTWSDTAIEIQNNAAVSLTASAAQIRRPIYGTSSGRWRFYRPHLEPLFRSLSRSGVTLPDGA